MDFGYPLRYQFFWSLLELDRWGSSNRAWMLIRQALKLSATLLPVECCHGQALLPEDLWSPL